MTNVGDLDQNLFALFARKALQQPDATAVIDATGATSYAALLERAMVIAETLAQRGLRPEQPVGVLMKRTADLVATLLGIMAAGGCYVPLDPDDPPERAGRIVDSAQCKLILLHRRLLPEFETRLRATNLQPGPVELVEIENCVAHPHKAKLPEAPGGHRLAYVLFTSGSTGLPKGVEIEHRSVVNLLLAARDLFGFTESDRYLATSTIGFDISVAELFLPLITGGAVVLRERQLVLDPRGLVRAIRDDGVTVFQTGPSVWSMLLAEVPEFPRLRVAVTTGEAIAPDLARRLAGVGDAVWNLYGPTEATVWATGHRLERDAAVFPARSSVSAPIGKPFANVAVRVLDELRTPVAPGIEGELWIGGEAVARGYCRNEPLTSERFVNLGDGSGTWFRTGDVVASDADGTIHYFGRNDDQIKVRGVRIEPMEVESAILTHPGVAQAAATWFAAASDARTIVAAVVVRPECKITAVELHHFLVPLLPTAMVPSRFMFCDSLPMTPSGKVDRKAIRTRATSQATEQAAKSGSDAATETERTLIGIWERTLNIKSVRRGDHFFSIGGDSLSAVTMMLEVEAVFDVTLAFRVVFEASTLDKLAEHIDHVRSKKAGGMKAPVPTNDLGNTAFVYPLSQSGRGRPVFFNGFPHMDGRMGEWDLKCPLYACTQWALGIGFSKADSVEELARLQIDALREFQSYGPYRLAGHSFGALVAFEMAQQLRRGGESVELLFLLDPCEPFADDTHVSAAPFPSANGSPEKPGGRTTRTPIWQRIAYHLLHFYGRHPNPAIARLLPKDRGPAFRHAAKRVRRSYRPQSYDGEVLAMFDSTDTGRGMWQTLLSPTADLRILDLREAAMFVEPTLSRWLEPLRARLERKR